MKNRFLHCLLIFLLYSGLTVVLTWPATWHMGSRVIGPPGDNLQNVWNIWWMKTALFQQRTDPFFTPYLYHPFGTTLLFHTLSAINTACLGAMALAFNLLPVYNFGILVTFPIAGVGMYYLARHLVGSSLPAFLAGGVFTFSAYHFSHATAHLQLCQMGWTPLFLLFLIRTFEKERYVRGALLAGLFLAIAALSCFYAMIYSFIIGGLYLAWWLAFDRRFGWAGFFRRLWLAAIPFAVLAGPLLARMWVYGRNHLLVGGHEDWAFSADVASFIVPGAFSTYGAFFRDWWSAFTGNHWENANFLGLLIPLLVVYGTVWMWRREQVFWLGLGAVSLMLSLGSHLHVMGRMYDGASGPNIPLPYLLLRRLPIFSFTGVPERIQFITLVAFSILAAFGARNISQRWFKGRRATIINVSLIAIACLEQLSVPLPTYSIKLPEFYRHIDGDAILEVTTIMTRSPSLYYQTAHRRPIIGGYVARPTVDNERFVQNSPVIGKLFGVDSAMAQFQTSVDDQRADLTALLEQRPELYRAIARLPEFERGRRGQRILSDLGIRYITLPYITREYFRKLQRDFPFADDRLFQRLDAGAQIVDRMIREELGCGLVWESRQEEDFSVKVYRVPSPSSRTSG